jgi:hypothetical protein
MACGGTAGHGFLDVAVATSLCGVKGGQKLRGKRVLPPIAESLRSSGLPDIGRNLPEKRFLRVCDTLDAGYVVWQVVFLKILLFAPLVLKEQSP